MVRKSNPQYRKQYRLKNLEKCRKFSREWMRKDRKANPEKYRKIELNRRAYRSAFYKHRRKSDFKFNKKSREHALIGYYMKKTFVDLLKFDPCIDCGNSFLPCAMDFDHVKGKTDNIGRMMCRSFKNIVKELKKCELVCANCHRIRTWKRRLAFFGHEVSID